MLELRVPWNFFRIWGSLLVKVHIVLHQTVNSGAGNGFQLGNVSCFWLLLFMVVDIEGNNSMTTGASKIEDVQVKKKTLQVVWLLLSGNPRISGVFFPPNISVKFNGYGDYGLLGSRPVVRLSMYWAILELVVITAHLSLRPKVS